MDKCDSTLITKLAISAHKEKCYRQEKTYIESNMTELSLRSLAFILFIVAAGCSAEVDVAESADPMARTFKSLREEEKNDFLAYFLALGIKDWAEDQPRLAKNFMYRGDFLVKQLNLSDDKIQQFESLNIPKESRKKLLQWTKTEFNLTTRNVLDLLRTDRCQGEKCIHFPDIGELCCPW